MTMESIIIIPSLPYVSVYRRHREEELEDTAIYTSTSDVSFITILLLLLLLLL